MRKLAEKRWARVLAAALFLLFLLTAMFSQAVVSYGRDSGWYQLGNETGFQDTSACQLYVADATNYVAQNISWLNNPYASHLGSYAGSAFSYTVTYYGAFDTVITVDTRTENSIHVCSQANTVRSPVVIVYDQVEGYREYNYHLLDSNEDFRDMENAVSNAEENDGWSSSEMQLYTVLVDGYINLPVDLYDGCYAEYAMFETFFAVRYWFIAFEVLSLLLCALSLVVLCFGAAIRYSTRALPGILRIPFDAGAFILLTGLGCALLLSESVANWLDFRVLRKLFASNTEYCFYFGMRSAMLLLLIVLAAGIFLYYMSAQLGAGVLRERLLVRRLRIPAGWYIGVFIAVQALALGALRFAGHLRLLWFFLLLGWDAALAVGIFLFLRSARSVRHGAQELARGNLTYQIDTGRLRFLWRGMGNDLNSIGGGLAKAVEDRVRSERMKTELITNVSHDLKTPLTSIINYIDLLKREDLDESTRREYLAILEKQSQKLKKLTVDVVEASKAASGALTVLPEPIDMRELLEQSVGEYADRLEKAGLIPVIKYPDGEAVIIADSTLLGRVIENLTTNIVKYAQPGTRVYFDLEITGNAVLISFKNISREPLNITAEELMERFVRGDSSRHTEGSGLGLSIARNLTELMGGTMELVLDGDLFRVDLRFPVN